MASDIKPSTGGPVIGFDASSTLGERTGVGFAAAQLLGAMAEQLPERWSMRVLVNSARAPLPLGDPWLDSDRLKVVRRHIPGRYLLRAWQHLKWPRIESLLGPLDLHHCPASYVTPARRAVSVLTVHDLYFLEGKENQDPFGTAYFAKTFPAGLPHADRLIAISDHTRRRLMEAYSLPSEKISVIHLGVDGKTFNERGLADDRLIADVHSQGHPYLLCVSTVGPRRKNLTALIEAFSLARNEAPDLPTLLVVGRIDDSPVAEEVRQLIERLKLKEHVRLTGYAAAADLPALYRRARAFLMPSLDEGFGIPVLEAMASGCPTLIANAGALPEIAGSAALECDPNSPESMAEGIKSICTDEDLRDRLREAGLERAKRFTWASAARSTLELYAEALGRSLSE